MTGREHTEESQDLYYSTGKPTRNTGVPYATVEHKRKKKLKDMKRKATNRRKY